MFTVQLTISFRYTFSKLKTEGSFGQNYTIVVDYTARESG